MLNNEVEDELYIIKTIKQQVNRGSLLYKMDDTKRDMIFDFKKFKAKQYFGRDIWKDNITLQEAIEGQ